jgi:hypothetical protein
MYALDESVPSARIRASARGAFQKPATTPPPSRRGRALSLDRRQLFHRASERERDASVEADVADAVVPRSARRDASIGARLEAPTDGA